MKRIVNTYQLMNIDEVKDNFQSEEEILKSFHSIWDRLCHEVGVNIPKKAALDEMRRLIIYEALDGSRSTLSPFNDLDRGLEGALYALHFIHVLKTLGVQVCIIMVHTAYNRHRGDNEFHQILQCIKNGAPLIKRYSTENSIQCSCVCASENHELQNLLNEITHATKEGDFNSIFLFDYTEEWAMTKQGQEFINILPNIDVHIRHTKFQFSGGWIPGKMANSSFLYSQNGTTYSNWSSDELVVLAALSLLVKLLHKGEGLTKVYQNTAESQYRYELREIKLFNKVIMLRESPKKLFMIGSPSGIYQVYY